MDRSRLILKDAADELPSPNGVALAIMQLWNSDTPSITQIARLVETDPALSGRLLRLANAASRARRPVVSIREAVARLGRETVKQVAVAFSLVDPEQERQCEAFDYAGFASHSLLVAMLARQLASQSNTAPPEDLFACALLARVGCLALATVYPQEYTQILTGSSPSLVAEERHRFGFDHNDLSYELMRDYGVPEPLARPAVHHESLDRLGDVADGRRFRIAALLHIAYRLANQGFQTRDAALDDETLDRVTALAHDALDMDSQRLRARFADAINEWLNWSQVFSLPESHPVGPDSAPETQAADRHDDPQEDGRKRALVLQTPSDPPLTEPLEAAGFGTCHRDDQEQMLRTAVEHQPDLLVIDQAAITGSAERLLRLIRSTEWGRAVYIVLIGDHLDEPAQAPLYAAGIDMYLEREMAAESLADRLAPAHRLAELKSLWLSDRRDLRRTANQLVISRRKFETLSMTDTLTGLPNRRAGMAELERAWAQWSRGGPAVGIIALDLDHFKRINDHHGHAAGDRLLAEVASVWSGVTRQGETLCRSGGEEFLVITTGIDLAAMKRIAVRLQQATREIAVPWRDSVIGISVSMGLAHSSEATDQEALLNRADKALYAAKEGGRNRICFRDNDTYLAV